MKVYLVGLVNFGSHVKKNQKQVYLIIDKKTDKLII